MKILDVLKSKIPNAYKDKFPKAKVYKVKKSPYGVDTGTGESAASGADGAAAGAN